MGIVKATKLIFDYITRDEEDNVEEVKRAINNLNIDIIIHRYLYSSMLPL